MSDDTAPPSAPAEGLTPRQRLLWAMYDFSAGRGLEVGPLHQPIAPRSHCDVVYVDVFDRAGLLEHYQNDPAVPPEQVPEIDVALFDGERVRSIPEAVGDAGFDWVVASHVAEHVPDLVGWLRQIAEVTRDGGDLVLAVPDRRYCFDLHRQGTSVGQMLAAHEAGDTVPSVRAVYDSFHDHAPVRAPMVWANDPVGYENRIYTLPLVLEKVAAARSGEYVDCHVWTYTPGSFLEAVRDLRALGLCEWTVRTLVPTRPNQLEFFAVLTRLPRSGDWPAELLADEPQPGRMPDWLQEVTDLRAGLERELADTRAALATADRRAARLQARLEAAHARDRRRIAARAKATLRRSPAGDRLAQLRRAIRRRGTTG